MWEGKQARGSSSSTTSHDTEDLNTATAGHLIKLLYHVKDGKDATERYLEMMGLDINFQDTMGKTVLMLAASHGLVETVAMLVQDFQARPHMKDKSGRNAVMYAAMYGYTEVACMLVMKYHVNPRETDDVGNTASHHAARHCHMTTAKVLERLEVVYGASKEKTW